MLIRTAQSIAEVQEAYKIEEASYPLEAAASLNAFYERFRLFHPYFIVAEQDHQIVGVANGIRLNHEDLSDEGMKQMSGYDQDGRNFCLLTVAVDADFRGHGIGYELLNAVIQQAKQDNLEHVLLMCEEHLIHFYQRAGFVYVKPSASGHAGIAWHEMKLIL
ncbi:GNAT family N-acetyltransferase [Paenibacillus rigui]|uniref:N-acetyltransferase domain-containing protein n=1 Tax=Paenibacillus rigui TaxID=554312 RepID=A0A229UKZ8_9BACL|nr:GNAT family N-acetyltransferase [Paenibacillus rigui]OXM84127.1 hypothetical protein CF651_22060 [Paenibacillus rigui]